MQTSCVSSQCALLAHHTVTGDEDGDGIAAYRAAHSLGGLAAKLYGQLPVSDSFTVGDLKKLIPHKPLKVGAFGCQRKLGRRRTFSAEVPLQPKLCGIEHRKITIGQLAVTCGKVLLSCKP